MSSYLRKVEASTHLNNLGPTSKPIPPPRTRTLQELSAGRGKEHTPRAGAPPQPRPPLPPPPTPNRGQEVRPLQPLKPASALPPVGFFVCTRSFFGVSSLSQCSVTSTITFLFLRLIIFYFWTRFCYLINLKQILLVIENNISISPLTCR
jgi:hypothetical protein